LFLKLIERDAERAACLAAAIRAERPADRFGVGAML
jgi:hypothetical protein